MRRALLILLAGCHEAPAPPRDVPAPERAGDRCLSTVTGLPVELDEGAAITLCDGTRRILFSWGEGRRWIRPAHSRDEIDRREADFAAEAERLPPSLAARVRARLRLLATVSVAEGHFDGVATHAGDPAASVGIFQWATSRHRADEGGSSLARFFSSLRRQAESEALAKAAWEECRGAGLDLRAGRLLLDGKPATGATLERRLAPLFGRGALRTWQLVAASDDVDRFGAKRVRGRSVSSLLAGERALATGILLAVNRPAWLVPSLECAVSGARADDLTWELRRCALRRYRPAERERRAMRLLTSESW